MGLIDEIREQPAVVDRLLRAIPGEVGPLVRAVRRTGVDHVLIAARGSSDHAGVYGQYALGVVGRLPVALAAPSIFSRYGRPPRIGRALVIGISQSGQSPDVVSVVSEARRQKALTLGITNAAHAPLALAADSFIDLGAGPERSVAATKTYTAELAAIAILAAAIGELDADGRRQLHRLPETMAEALRDEDAPARAAGTLGSMDECVVVGRGFNLATAMEWSLKLKELAGVRAQAYSAADYAHGPIASFALGAHLLAVAARGPLLGDLEQLIERLAIERRARVTVLAGGAIAGAGWVRFPDALPEWLSPLIAILPAQLLTGALTRLRGMDVECPRGLAKVTLTR
jgi:glucosamine--fructose-6-phosphate aminotransferase (isomerizing)